MKKPALNIGILLILIIALPPLVFTTYEVGSYYQNEQMIDSIYTSQLESVLFSVNQYSDDVVSAWANQVTQDLQFSGNEPEIIAASFLQQKRSVQHLFFATGTDIVAFYPGSSDSLGLNLKVKKSLLENETTLQRLLQYLDGGYRKIQPIPLDTPGISLFVFALKSGQNQKNICGLVVNSEGFIRENLGPKMQSVAGEKFYLSVFDGVAGQEIYSSELQQVDDKNIEHTKPLWLMPDYSLGIQLRGETIEDLVQQRMKSGVWLIVLIDLVLILAAVFVYRAIRQQIKLARLKSEFVSNVSHEIRTPLAVINMYSETLEMGRIKDDEKKMEYYKIIHAETNRLSGIVNKILSFSKIEGGNRNYNFVPTDVNDLTDQIIRSYNHHFNSNGMTCTFSPGADLPVVNLDPEAVTDAVINLIDNAIKYSDGMKKIEIFTGTISSAVYIGIKDYGIGIEEKHQKQVFDKFYRVTSGNLAHKAKGTGIGLSIVKHIMDAHQGSVTLKSRPGKGSTFRLNFPVDKPVDKTI